MQGVKDDTDSLVRLQRTRIEALRQHTANSRVKNPHEDTRRRFCLAQKLRQLVCLALTRGDIEGIEMHVEEANRLSAALYIHHLRDVIGGE
jgi:hypothetical protein